MNQPDKILFFNKRSIKCACGEIFNINAARMTAKECPKCKNRVVYDQKKGETAVCPVCKEMLNTTEQLSRTSTFLCPQCNCTLLADKSAGSYECPICSFNIDVQKEIAKTELQKEDKVSVIKYEGNNNTLVWKHPIEDFTMGSQLIVHESQEALFFRDGQALDLFLSGRHTLETQKLPFISKIHKLPTDPEGTFHSEIYFTNMAVQMGIKWGTDNRVRFFDPATGIHFDIGACGELNLKVADSRKLILKLVGTTDKLMNSDLIGKTGSGESNTGLIGNFRALIMTRVKTHLAKTIKEEQINILEIDEHLESLSEALKAKINEGLIEYGLIMPEFWVTTISTPDDKNYNELRQLHANRFLKIRAEENMKAEAEAAQERKIVQQQTEAQLEIIKAQGKAQAYTLQAQAEAEEMRMKGYTYAQETARQVGVGAVSNPGVVGSAEGIGMMGGMMNLGIGLGAMSGVVEMTKDALKPVTNVPVIADNLPNENTWDCGSCGQKVIAANFCGNCGAKKPEVFTAWDCPCGQKGVVTKFCGNCGSPKLNPAKKEEQNG